MRSMQLSVKFFQSLHYQKTVLAVGGGAVQQAGAGDDGPRVAQVGGHAGQPPDQDGAE